MFRRFDFVSVFIWNMELGPIDRPSLFLSLSLILNWRLGTISKVYSVLWHHRNTVPILTDSNKNPSDSTSNKNCSVCCTFPFTSVISSLLCRMKINLSFLTGLSFGQFGSNAWRDKKKRSFVAPQLVQAVVFLDYFPHHFKQKVYRVVRC
jgi:hypothetical protein